MERIVILGPRASGKTVLARRLGSILGLPVIELDALFWTGDDLIGTPPSEWEAVTRDLCKASTWIADGDLGPYDVLWPRLRQADTVIIVELARWRCVIRALRRSRERPDFWRWVWHWRKGSLPQLLEAVTVESPHAALHRFGKPREIEQFLANLQ